MTDSYLNLYDILSDMISYGRISIRLPEHLMNEIKQRHDKKNMSTSRIVRDALQNYFYGEKKVEE